MHTLILRLRLRIVLMLAAFFWALGTLDARADNTGKISGTIRDKDTKEPLLGANIVVVGTNLGGTTDEQGFFYILRVPPGTYSVRVSMIGFQAVIVTEVKVKADLTTEVTTALSQTSIQAKEVIVVAEQRMVQKDVTSTRKTVSRETMTSTPGMESATDIFKLQAGSVLSSVPQSIRLSDGAQLQVRDESLKDIHIRGGRGGEILYMVDGMPVTHPIYGGRSVIDLNVSDVESVELLTGAFNAEYGQAQSGVVNINTRSGGERYKGGFEYKTDQVGLLGESYMTDYASLYLSGPEPLTQEFLPLLGLKPPGQITFFASLNGNLTNTPYDNHRDRNDITLFGINTRERQENTQNVNAKLNWDLPGEHRLTFNYHGSRNQWSSFVWEWKNYPNRIASYRRDNTAFNAQYTNVLSKATYVALNFGYLGVNYRGSWGGKTPADFWYQDSTGRYISTIAAPTLDPASGFFDNQGFESIWRDDHTETYTFKGDLTSQIHPQHLIKTGVEFRWNKIKYVDIQDGGYKLSLYGQGLDSLPPPGPFPMFGLSRWVFDVDPLIGSVYIQDKFELEYLIMNIGIRFDWFTLGSTVMSHEWKSVWQRATGMNPDWSNIVSSFSPRFGISFPISEFSVVFFSYGHFNQLPELQFYYRDPYSSSFTGNPKLDYEQTILYEFGLTNQITQNWAIDIKSYAKDISRQIGTTTVTPKDSLGMPIGRPVELYDNLGYARARGLEMELTRKYENFVSGKLTYTIQWASGYSSSAFDDYIRSTNNFPKPIRERALGWDVRHQVISQVSLASPVGLAPTVFDVELPDDWNLTFLYRYSTGMPYTPGPATNNPVEQQKQENTVYGPSSSTMDLKFEKGLNFSGIRMAFVVDVFNLFDQRNIQMSYGFNTWTGKPFRYGDVQKPQKNFFDYYTMLSLMDPRQYSTGRTAKVGVRIDF